MLLIDLAFRSSKHCLMSLKKTLKRQTSWTWNRIKEAHLFGVRFGEETLTECNLLEIAKRHPREVATITFHRRAEYRTGADWEWWFIGRSGRAIGLRVQAKVVSPGTMTYDHLHYSNTAGYQSDVLVREARAQGLIPLFCTYNFWPRRLRRRSWSKFPGLQQKREYGCSVMHPLVVSVNRPVLGVQRFLPFLYPWHLIFDNTSSIDLSDSVAERCNRLLSRAPLTDEIKATFEADSLNQRGYAEFIRDRVPSYVTTALQRSVDPKDLPRHDTLNGIIVIQQNED